MSNWSRLPEFVKGHRLFRKDLVNGGETTETNPISANLVSSIAFEEDGVVYHRPLLDIDFDAALLRSSTPGHHHLYLDKLLTADEYDNLVRVLVDVGILQQGILDCQWKAEGKTMLRLPGDVKQKKSLSSGGLLDPEPDADKIPIPTFDTKADAKSPVDINVSVQNMAAPKSSEDFIKPMLLESKFSQKTPIVYEDLTTDMKPAMMMFGKLAEIAKATGHSLYETISAWKEFADIK